MEDTVLCGELLKISEKGFTPTPDAKILEGLVEVMLKLFILVSLFQALLAYVWNGILLFLKEKICNLRYYVSRTHGIFT